MKRPNAVWITALILGWFFDFLFWKHAPGINFAIYVLLCLAGGFVVLGMEGIKPAWKALLLLLPVLFFAAMSFIRQEPFSMLLSFAFSLGLMGVLACTYLGGDWLRYGVADYIVNFLKLAGSMIARPLTFLTGNRKQTLAEGTSGEAAANPKTGQKQIWAILRGVLIAIPIVAIFATLLASADAVFAQRLNDLTRLFRLENLPEYIFRGVYILIGAYLLIGIFLHAAQKSRVEKLVGEDKALVPQFLGFTEAAVVLGAVALLFAVFVVIQFQYFFGGQANIHIDGYTYAEYARRGFGELVAVAFFSLLLFLGLSGITRRETSAKRGAFSGLGIGMVALVAVMLISAYQRLRLYEAAYGFSRLRTYTNVFMIWLGVVLLVMVVLEILRKERVFTTAALLAGIGFAVTLALLNVDGFIVRQNVARSVAGKELDVATLASLSTDGIPAMVEAYQSPLLSSGLQDSVGAALACMQASAPSHPDIGWQSFTLTGLWSRKALKSLDLSSYKVNKDNGLVKVTSPQGKEYDCQGSVMSD